MTDPTYQPFPGAWAYTRWHASNCAQCKKGPKPDQCGPNEACDIENAMTLSSMFGGSMLLGGEVTQDQAAAMAKRLDWDGVSYIPNEQCPELEAI